MKNLLTIDSFLLGELKDNKISQTDHRNKAESTEINLRFSHTFNEGKFF